MSAKGKGGTMKKKALLWLLIMVMSFSILSGCSLLEEVALGSTKGEAQVAKPGLPGISDFFGPSGEEGEAQSNNQKAMPKQELAVALREIDLSVLCAGFDANLRVERLADAGIVTQTQVVCADYNKDGLKDVLLGRLNDLTFSLAPERKAEYAFSQSSPVFFTDNEGNIYRCNSISDGFDIEVQGKPAWVEHHNVSYSLWQNNSWVPVYSHNGSRTFVTETGADGQETENMIEDTTVATINGQEATKADLDSHFASIGMRQISTWPSEYTKNTYDAAYRDSLVEGLNTYFADNYSGYTQVVNVDIDGDGQEESLFVLPNFLDTWYNSLQATGEYADMEAARSRFKNEFYQQYFAGYSYTGVVIVDMVDDKVTVTTHCALQDISARDGMNAYMENGYLWLDGNRVYLNGYFASVGSNVPAELAAYLADFGYSDTFITTVDVSAWGEDEYLSVCRKDGRWFAFLFAIKDGNPVVLYSNPLEEYALFLTQHQGQQSLMTYYQSVYTQGGITTTGYDYTVLRIDENAEQEELEFAYAIHTNQDKDATAVSRFFQKLDRQLDNVVVVWDPYKLAGREWMPQAHVQYGTAPQEQEEEQSTDNTQVGFVQIEDPSSWLHLRKGPGVTYDLVLLDPTDPDSFVRQALGSPVTVLETIETGDKDNPVWVKIRITYADREIEGYSSKKYIRLAGE